MQQNFYLQLRCIEHRAALFPRLIYIYHAFMPREINFTAEMQGVGYTDKRRQKMKKKGGVHKR